MISYNLPMISLKTDDASWDRVRYWNLDRMKTYWASLWVFERNEANIPTKIDHELRAFHVFVRGTPYGQRSSQGFVLMLETMDHDFVPCSIYQLQASCRAGFVGQDDKYFFEGALTVSNVINRGKWWSSNSLYLCGRSFRHSPMSSWWTRNPSSTTRFFILLKASWCSGDPAASDSRYLKKCSSTFPTRTRDLVMKTWRGRTESSLDILYALSIQSILKSIVVVFLHYATSIQTLRDNHGTHPVPLRPKT